MLKNILKITVFALTALPALAPAQFRTRDRLDRLEGFDQKRFSWGFFLAGNSFDYKLVLDPNLGMNGNQNAIEAKSTESFGAGLIGRMRLHENLDLRAEPGLHFIQRRLNFNTQENSPERVLTDADINRTVKSTYIDIPILLEVHGDRWYNSRPYAAAGVNYLVNLQSNEGAAEDNSNGIFRTTTHNFGWSVEAGIQFYFSRFKLTPGFRGTFVTNNELVKDNPGTPPYWTAGITSAQTRAFMFVLKFE